MRITRRPLRRVRTRYHLGLTTITGLAVARALILGEPALAAPPVALPVPCTAGSCAGIPKLTTQGFAAPAGFVTSGKATAVQSGNTLNVTQTTNQAILNWASFNIGAGGTVNFQQPNSNAVALNKIYQNNPSSIFGSLNANGQVYLINPNGFVFGAGSTVNVAGLVASSLGLTGGDTEFANGLATQIQQTQPQSALSSDGRIFVVDSSGNIVPDANGNPQLVQISVQPGAQITANHGLALLAGQAVTNAGTVSAPSGQVVLAAGQTVYLAGSADPAVRGLVVAVTNNGPTISDIGTVTNMTGGTLSSSRGNVSLVGLAVNQNGRISATTSVSSNGSVVLQAGQGGAGGKGSDCVGGEAVCTTQGGQVILGSTSRIDILPEYSDPATLPVVQTQIQSKINVIGQQVLIEGGQINAPAGNLNVVAATNPDTGLKGVYDPNAELRVAAGTSINLAGSNATVPMSANLVSIQLNSNELEDDPSQRTGPLKGKTVILDVRNGKPAIVSENSWQSTLQATEENIAQRTSVGGTASFQSVGDVVVNPGAKIDVSGGQWNYTAGVAQTSMLLGANGKAYEVSSADPNLAYKGIINPTYTQTYNGFGVQITSPTPGFAHYYQGYTQGFSAGSVSFAAPAMSLQGTLLGTAVNGAYQRSAANIPAESLMGYIAKNGGNGLATNGIAIGGTLNIGANPGAGAASIIDSFPSLFAPAVAFSNSAAPVIVADGAPLPAQTLQLTTAYITNGGFTQTHIFSDSTVTLPAGMPLNLGVGGDLQITAPRININSNITAANGVIALQSEDTAFHQAAGGARLGIDLAAGVKFDVSGQWTNDLPAASGTNIGAVYQNGGTISLALSTPAGVLESGGELVLGNGVTLDANGGAWVQANGKIVGGLGGSITLDASSYESAFQVGNNVALAAFGVQGAKGGAFSLLAPVINVAQGNGSWAAAQQVDWLPPSGSSSTSAPLTTLPVFDVGAGLFSKYGFSAVSLTATDPIVFGAPSADLLTIAAGTTIDAQAQSLQLTSGYQTRRSGGTVQGFTTPVLLPEAFRLPYTVTLGALPPTADVPNTTAYGYGNLDVQVGSAIVADPLSTISLSSLGSIRINGVLRAPGGTINATIGELPGAAGVDYGFLSSQALELGATGVLDVSGATILTPNMSNLRIGKVLPGGTVTLVADRAALITDFGSLIDVDGGSGLLDVLSLTGTGGYRPATMGGMGGQLAVTSGESISLLGAFSAAPGASSVGKLEGGTLSVSLNTDLTANNNVSPGDGYVPFAVQAPTIELVSSTTGSSPAAAYGNQAVLGVTQLEQSGIDVLALQVVGTNGTVAIGTNTPVSMGREIIVDAPNVSVSYGTAASLLAPYISFTNSSGVITAPVALSGTGLLNVTAAQIAFSGVTALQGVANAAFTSSGDIEFQPTPAFQNGSLTLAGNLTLNAARVYPATYAVFSIQDSSGTVSIGQTTESPGTPLSAGGALKINALNIVNAGTLLAPFGSLELDGTNSVELKSGSVTSVSAAGATIPFGQTLLNQGEWVTGTGAYPSKLNAPPTGLVTLNGPNVSFDRGATVNLSGGGDLSAYEFVPGTGGSVDVLNQTPGLYAIVPSLGGSYAAYDVQRFGATSATLGFGASVYLSGLGGLAAGTYTLLPATYALSMPNAYLVQAEPTFTSLTPGTIGHLVNGTPVISGYLTFGNTGLQAASGYQGFAIYAGNYSQTLGQYGLSNASGFFAANAAAAAAAGLPHVGLPADAGALLIHATSSLNALGSINSAAGSGGAGATIEVSANDLVVTRNSTDPVAAGVVSISAPVLDSWNAGNLVLGGQFKTDPKTGVVSLDATANTVTFAPGAQLSATQILAVANSSIDVQSGAVLSSTSGAGGAAPKFLPGAEALPLSGSNPVGVALLAVSDSNLVLASGYKLDPTNVPNASPISPTIDVESGAALNTRGAVSLYSPTAVSATSPVGMNIDGAINAPGASWSLAANSIGFVGNSGLPSGAAADALLINPALLTQMQAAGAVQLTSTGAIDLFTAVSMGASSATSSPSLGALTLTGSAINNCVACSSIFGAQTLTLVGTGTSTAATAGTGSLTLVANTLNLTGAGNPTTSSGTTTATGSLTLNGNFGTDIEVSGAVIGQGTNPKALSTVAFSGDVTIAAAELTAASRTGTAISLTDGTLTISQKGTAASTASLAGSIGGQLALTANAITDTGSIIVPGGTATLAANGDIALGSGAKIDTSGITVSVGTQTETAAGGIVNISAGGVLSLASGSTINVSGAGSAPAGSLSLLGVGSVTADASFLGRGGTGATGGSFSLQAGSLDGGLSHALVTHLTSGGFNNQLGIRVHSGDLDLASDDTLSANNITLTADQGAVNIGGKLTAKAAGQSGFIGLYGGSGLSLLSGATLTAGGIASSGHGGQIDLSSTCSACAVNLAAGSTIATNGGSDGGELIVAAPVYTTSGSASADDVAINIGGKGLGADVSRVGKVIIEPVQIMSESSGTIANNLSTDISAVAQYLAAASPNIATRLNPKGSPKISVQVGLQIVDAANEALVLPALDLTQYSSPYNGGTPEVINLTVRAAGDLTIGGKITDGYDAANGLYTAGADSGTFRFVAGADPLSANPLATAVVPLNGTGATLTLSNGALVSTGTGDIAVASAGDIKFLAGSSVYTTGTLGAPVTNLGTPSTPILTNFPTGGGNIVVRAGQDVDGVLPADDASVSYWEARNSRNSSNALDYDSKIGNDLGTWGVDLTSFGKHPWDAASFGGGDVSVTAGRDASAVTAATANSLYLFQDGATQTLLPGGGLAVAAGRDVITSEFFAADGVATISAGRSVTSVPLAGSADPLGSTFWLQNAAMSVWAQDDIAISGIFNPTMVASLSTATPVSFYTFGPDSAFSAQSASGDISYYNTGNAANLSSLRKILGPAIVQKVGLASPLLTVAPPSLRLVALTQNITKLQPTLYPSANGQLELFAGKDLSGSVFMSDVPLNLVSTPQNVQGAGGQNFLGSNTTGGLQKYNFFADLHANDPTPAVVVAGEDINGLVLSVPKPTDIEAGRDIVNLSFFGQNFQPNDITLISAGRDFIDQTTFNPSGTPQPPLANVQLGGPGSLMVLAGRNVDLGFSNGILTVGNLRNSNLPSAAGANLTVTAGLGDNLSDPDYSTFYQQVIAKSTTYEQQLVSYVESINGQSGLTFDQAGTAFAAFSPTQQQLLIDSVFFDELNQSGIEANKGDGFTRGYAAIDALFPGSRTGTKGSASNPYSGNLNLTYSQIYTESGGDISLLAPGGSINVGLAVPPAVATPKLPSQLGIVAEGPGDVDIYSKSDVNVDSSRIFTLGGGNILIWSDEGNIDAGKGSKTSLSAPPPTYTVDSKGNVVTSFGAAVAGSGIRTIKTNPSQAAGNVNLIAPFGFVDAGEAGINAAGAVNIAALAVVNAANISYGTTATGVPPLVSGITASLAGAASAASSATTGVSSSMAAAATKDEMAPMTQAAISWLDVFVSGLGEENCKPEDSECLKRQTKE